MKVTLINKTPKLIRRARHLVRHSGLLLTLRNGNLYTMTYNPGRQPNSESQLKNRSLFKEANDRVKADFAIPSRRAYWNNRLHAQKKYKTARGLARAYYMNTLRKALSHKCFKRITDTRTAILSLRPVTHSSASSPRPLVTPLSPSSSLPVYARLHWWRRQLAHNSIP